MVAKSDKPDRVVVGVISGAFGVKGELRIKSFCATPEDIASYGPLYDEAGNSYTLKIVRAVKGGFAARIKGIQYKDQADALKGVKLLADRDRLPVLPDDEYYYADLIGLTALDTGGAEMGKVAAILNHGAGDIVELRGSGLKGSLLIPFTQEAVPTVDLSAKRIIVYPPEEIAGKED